ncbi:hypothetical protein ALISP_1840 [Alicycliphilus sp. B1]|nr:hypothetical protein ALISP_1840 [Alicycliphilus sp. B1]
MEVQESLHCGGELRAAWDVVCGGALEVGAGAFVGQDLTVHGDMACGKGLRGGHLSGGQPARGAGDRRGRHRAA